MTSLAPCSNPLLCSSRSFSQEKPHIEPFTPPHTGLCCLAGGRPTGSSLFGIPRRSCPGPGSESACSFSAGGGSHHPFLCSAWLDTGIYCSQGQRSHFLQLSLGLARAELELSGRCSWRSETQVRWLWILLLHIKHVKASVQSRPCTQGRSICGFCLTCPRPRSLQGSVPLVRGLPAPVSPGLWVLWLPLVRVFLNSDVSEFSLVTGTTA